MDDKDEKILEYLKKNGRAPFTEIGEAVGVSEGTVRNRVEKMREDGVIKNFTVEVEKNQGVSAFISVDISTEREFDKVVDELPEDLEVFELAGDTDLFVKISRESSEKINEVVDHIRSVDGVTGTKTYMVLSERS